MLQAQTVATRSDAHGRVVRHRSSSSMKLLWRILSLALFLQLVSATDLQCTVTRDADRTHYSVPQFTGEDCDFSWLNQTNHVMAITSGHSEQVARSSNRSLDTYQCFPQMFYSRTCTDGVNQVATCTFNCSVNSEDPQKGGAKLSISIQAEKSHRRAYGLIPAAFLVLVLVLVLVCYALKADRRKSGRGSPHTDSTEEVLPIV
ncbi:uncharacterized protein LOC144409412 [Gasterosteus aculeatus]